MKKSVVFDINRSDDADLDGCQPEVVNRRTPLLNLVNLIHAKGAQ